MASGVESRPLREGVMAGADIGGDDSVQWVVEVDSVRIDEKLKHESKGGRKWLQQGVDDAEDGDFTISIKIPKDSRHFVETLREAADEAERHAQHAGHLVSFKLPIEGKNHDQIQVRWRSKASATTT